MTMAQVKFLPCESMAKSIRTRGYSLEFDRITSAVSEAQQLLYGQNRLEELKVPVPDEQDPMPQYSGLVDRPQQGLCANCCKETNEVVNGDLREGEECSLSGMADVQDTRKPSTKEILKLRSVLYHDEQGIPFPRIVEMSNAVFRITVNHPNGGVSCGSGIFVEIKEMYWILTTCHNLLNGDDGKKMKDDMGQEIDHLEEKMRENLLYAKFSLSDPDPNSDKKFQLTREMSSKDVVCDDRSLVYDFDLDILAIPCKELEGFGGASFQLNLDAVREYTPAVGQILIMIHFPLDVPKHEDMDTTEHGQYSIGIMRKVLGVCVDFISNLLRGAFLLEMPKHEDKDHTVEYTQCTIGSVCKVIGDKTMMYDLDACPGSSGAPVFFSGSNGVTVVGIHRKCCDSMKLNQGSHLTADFVNRLTVDRPESVPDSA